MNWQEMRRELEIIARRATRWSHDHLPPGIRSIVGVVFFVGGLFGFLPILGFWMIPVGIMLIMLDLPFLRHKVIHWMNQDDTSAPENSSSGDKKSGGSS